MALLGKEVALLHGRGGYRGNPLCRRFGRHITRVEAVDMFAEIRRQRVFGHARQMWRLCQWRSKDVAHGKFHLLPQIIDRNAQHLDLVGQRLQLTVKHGHSVCELLF